MKVKITVLDSSSIEDTSLLGEIQQSAEKKSALEELPKGK